MRIKLPKISRDTKETIIGGIFCVIGMIEMWLILWFVAIIQGKA